MKITKSRLMEIIKEELAVVLESSMYGPTSLLRRSTKPKKIRQYSYDEPAYQSPELSSIGIADDPGENPLAPGPRYRTRIQSLEPNRQTSSKPLGPEEAKAHQILKNAGFRSRRPGDERVNLAMTQNKGWKLSEFGARSILDDAVEAGEISYETAYAVTMSLEKELYEV